MKIDDKKLKEWSENVYKSKQEESKTNENWHLYYGYVFDTCLTESDKSQLESKKKNTLDFSTLRPYIMHALKGMKDAMPTTSFENVEADDADFPNIPAEIVADKLTEKKEEIFVTSATLMQS